MTITAVANTDQTSWTGVKEISAISDIIAAIILTPL